MDLSKISTDELGHELARRIYENKIPHEGQARGAKRKQYVMVSKRAYYCWVGIVVVDTLLWLMAILLN